METMKKGILAVLLLLMLTAGVCAHADAPVPPASGFLAEAPEETVSWWYSSREKAWYLFLPSCAQDTLTLDLSGLEEPLLDGENRGNSPEVSCRGGEEYLLTSGEKSYRLRILRSENIAALFLHTESGTLETLKEKKTNTETGTALALDEAGGVVYRGAMAEIRGHGNSTFRLEKKSWHISLSEKAKLAGDVSRKGWILMANHFENSLVRNRITLDMAEYVGLRFTSARRYCDLYINGDYLGNYLILQPITVDMTDLSAATEAANHGSLLGYSRKGTVKAKANTWKAYDIPNDPEDITGGYLLELELSNRYEKNETNGFVTAHEQCVVIKEPERVTPAQAQYVLALFNELESALRAKDGKASGGRHYSEIIDVESFVLKMMLEETVKNHDGNRSSQYFYKDSDKVDGKLYAGPAWDYDRSYGSYYEGSPRAGTGRHWQVINYFPQKLYPKLYKRTELESTISEYYLKRFRPFLRMLLGEETIAGYRSLAEWEEFLRASARMNYIRWPVFNAESRKVQTGANWEENYAQLTLWITQRVEWLDKEWGQ